LSQIVLSAGTSGADDLSSLLQSAKGEFGAGVEKSATAMADAAVKATPEAVAKAPVKDLLKVAQSTFVQSEPITVEDGKVLPLGQFVNAYRQGNAPSSAIATADWETTRSNIELLKRNTFGSQATEFNYPKIDLPGLPDLPEVDLSSITQYFESLPEVGKVWVGSAAVVAFIIVGGINKTPSKKKAKAVALSKNIEASSDAIGDLTDELGTLQSRMKVLEATGLDLDSQLGDAKTKLTRKELDISKAKLKAADTSLSLNREIDLLKQKLQANDGKVKNLDDELSSAREECTGLLKELERSRAEAAKKKTAEAAELGRKKAKLENEEAKIAGAKAAELEKKKKADELAKKKLAIEAAKTEKADELAKKKLAIEAAKKEKADELAKKKLALQASKQEKADELAKKKAGLAAKKEVAPKPASSSTVKATVKETAPKAVTPPTAEKPVQKVAPKKAATKAKTEELPTAETPVQKATPKEVAPKKVVSKAKEEETVGVWTAAKETPEKPPDEKKAAPKAKAAANKGDLTTLSKSALSRTTVKVIVEYLDSKGVTTVDENGKILKKAILMEVVGSL